MSTKNQSQRLADARAVFRYKAKTLQIEKLTAEVLRVAEVGADAVLKDRASFQRRGEKFVCKPLCHMCRITNAVVALREARSM